MSDALTHIHEKLQRADEHIVQFANEADAFRNETPHAELVNYDAKAAEAFKRFHKQRPVPVRLSVLTGDVLYQLRSSLDHLACALILKDGGTLTKQSQFPISRFKPTKPKDVGRYERQIKGITRWSVRTGIEDLQPYTLGSRRDHHWLAILKTLSNTDKHRSLVLHVTAIQPRVSYVTSFGNGLDVEADDLDNGAQRTPGPDLVFGKPVEVMNVQRRLTTFVAFAQWPGAPYELPASLCLRDLFRGVRGVVKQFTSLL